MVLLVSDVGIFLGVEYFTVELKHDHPAGLNLFE